MFKEFALSFHLQVSQVYYSGDVNVRKYKKRGSRTASILKSVNCRWGIWEMLLPAKPGPVAGKWSSGLPVSQLQVAFTSCRGLIINKWPGLLSPVAPPYGVTAYWLQNQSSSSLSSNFSMASNCSPVWLSMKVWLPPVFCSVAYHNTTIAT